MFPNAMMPQQTMYNMMPGMSSGMMPGMGSGGMNYSYAPQPIWGWPNAGAALTPTHTLYNFVGDMYNGISKYGSPLYRQPMSVSLGFVNNPYGTPFSTNPFDWMQSTPYYYSGFQNPSSLGSTAVPNGYLYGYNNGYNIVGSSGYNSGYNTGYNSGYNPYGSSMLPGLSFPTTNTYTNSYTNPYTTSTGNTQSILNSIMNGYAQITYGTLPAQATNSNFLANPTNESGQPGIYHMVGKYAQFLYGLLFPSEADVTA